MTGERPGLSISHDLYYPKYVINLKIYEFFSIHSCCSLFSKPLPQALLMLINAFSSPFRENFGSDFIVAGMVIAYPADSFTVFTIYSKIWKGGKN